MIARRCCAPIATTVRRAASITRLRSGTSEAVPLARSHGRGSLRSLKPAPGIPTVGVAAGACITSVVGIRPMACESPMTRKSTVTREITAESARHSLVRVRHAHAVLRIMRPDPVASIPAASKTVVIEEEAVHENRTAKPVRSPAPATPSQSAEESTNVDARSESKSKPNARIKKRRVVTVNRRTPNVFGIVGRYINYLRISRLDLNRSLVPLRLGRNSFLRVRI